MSFGMLQKAKSYTDSVFNKTQSLQATVIAVNEEGHVRVKFARQETAANIYYRKYAHVTPSVGDKVMMTKHGQTYICEGVIL